MLPYFLIQQVLELFERETTFQGLRISLFLLAKRSGCFGLAYIRRNSLHTIVVFCTAKIELFWLIAKISCFFLTFAQTFEINENQTRNS